MLRYTCQVLGTGADGSTPCLLASVERVPLYGKKEEKVATVMARYLFNVGEGVARFAQEHGVKLPGIKKAFLCGTAADDAAGLPGLYLSLSSLGAPSLQLFGPRGVATLASATTELLQRRFPEVTAVPLELDADESSACFELEDDHFDIRAGVFDASRSATARHKRARDARTQARPLALYHCRAKHGDRPSFLVVSCPSPAYIAALAAHPLFKEGATYIFHLAPTATVTCAAYAPLLAKSLGRHVVVNDGGRCQPPFAEDKPLQRDLLYLLGTGSAAPSKSRGCSGLLLKLAARSGSSSTKTGGGDAAAAPPLSLLMDAGEGTYGHLCRQFGAAGALAQLRALDAIWISHKHADHMTGLWRLLCLRAGCSGGAAEEGGSGGAALPPLPVIAPETVLRWLTACASVSPGHVAAEPLRFRDARAAALHSAYELRSVNATFDDARAADAARKRHCTAGEALRVARRMGARAAVLTHFSQRYPRVPALAEGQSAAVAFDGMVVELAAAARLREVTALVCRVLTEGKERRGREGAPLEGGGGKGGGGDVSEGEAEASEPCCH
ncbi:beta-lactamase-like protein [Tribonema minus]|uniref:ribonuclease Z n=1 Tax=Tribonema minus TaxID=303371 RepID=A0A836C9Z1_9STRA|nr:beta-lactamase-like protein [Tribonema minus]